MSGKASKDKKTQKAKRQTPMDRRMEKDIHLARNVGERVKAPPRKATSAEVHADNNAAYEAAYKLFNIKDRLDEFRGKDGTKPRGRGRPMLYSDAIILLAVEVMGFLSLDFRTSSGIVAGLLANFDIRAPSYSRFFERCEKLIGEMVLAAPVTDGRILCRYYLEDPTGRIRRLAIDSTGLTLTNITLWCKTKWGVGPKYRGWLKVHALVDIDTNEIVAFILTEDYVGDEGMLEYLLELADMGASGTRSCTPTRRTPPSRTSSWSARSMGAGSSPASRATPQGRTWARRTAAMPRDCGSACRTTNGWNGRDMGAGGKWRAPSQTSNACSRNMYGPPPMREWSAR